MVVRIALTWVIISDKLFSIETMSRTGHSCETAEADAGVVLGFAGTDVTVVAVLGAVAAPAKFSVLLLTPNAGTSFSVVSVPVEGGWTLKSVTTALNRSCSLLNFLEYASISEMVGLRCKIVSKTLSTFIRAL